MLSGFDVFFGGSTGWRRSVGQVAVSSILFCASCNDLWEPWLLSRGDGGSDNELECSDMKNLQPASFFKASDAPVGNSPTSLAIGHLDKDGILDLVVTNINSADISIMLGDGNGNFSVGTYPAGSAPTSVGLGRFDGEDQDLDIVVNDVTNFNLSVIRGNGAGGVGTGGVVSPGTPCRSVAVDDLDLDQKFDLICTNESNDNLSVLLNTSTALMVSFGSPKTFSVGTGPYFTAVGDFKSDGKPDLVVANKASRNISILINKTTAKGIADFDVMRPVPAGTGPRAVAVGQFNSCQDQKLDVAVANESSTVSVLLGDGAGGLGTATDFSAGSNPYFVAVGDFNGDTKPDLAVANYESNDVSILLGNGIGGFAAASNFAVGTKPGFVVVGDFDRDTKPDLAVANFGSNNISILINQTP